MDILLILLTRSRAYNPVKTFLISTIFLGSWTKRSRVPGVDKACCT